MVESFQTLQLNILLNLKSKGKFWKSRACFPQPGMCTRCIQSVPNCRPQCSSKTNCKIRCPPSVAKSLRGACSLLSHRWRRFPFVAHKPTRRCPARPSLVGRSCMSLSRTCPIACRPSKLVSVQLYSDRPSAQLLRRRAPVVEEQLLGRRLHVY